MKISKNEAFKHSRAGLDGLYFQMPNINNGTTIVYAKVTGEHGQRTIGEHARIYYVLKGTALFVINGENTEASQGDVVAIPAQATYNFQPRESFVEVLLIMELLDLDKLPK